MSGGVYDGYPIIDKTLVEALQLDGTMFIPETTHVKRLAMTDRWLSLGKVRTLPLVLHCFCRYLGTRCRTCDVAVVSLIPENDNFDSSVV